MKQETSFAEFCEVLEGQEADIIIHAGRGEDRLELKGPLPLLFHAACEIVKQLALMEGDGTPGIGKSYVAVLCRAVSEELDDELAGRDRLMTKTYRGAAERAVDRMIADGRQEIKINWINMSAKESGSGGADRITRRLIDTGYRPDGADMVDKYRADYVAGRKVDGRYIRLPQETWRKSA